MGLQRYSTKLCFHAIPHFYYFLHFRHFLRGGSGSGMGAGAGWERERDGSGAGGRFAPGRPGYNKVSQASCPSVRPTATSGAVHRVYINKVPGFGFFGFISQLSFPLPDSHFAVSRFQSQFPVSLFHFSFHFSLSGRPVGRPVGQPVGYSFSRIHLFI